MKTIKEISMIAIIVLLCAFGAWLLCYCIARFFNYGYPILSGLLLVVQALILYSLLYMKKKEILPNFYYLLYSKWKKLTRKDDQANESLQRPSNKETHDDNESLSNNDSHDDNNCPSTQEEPIINEASPKYIPLEEVQKNYISKDDIAKEYILQREVQENYILKDDIAKKYILQKEVQENYILKVDVAKNYISIVNHRNKIKPLDYIISEAKKILEDYSLSSNEEQHIFLDKLSIFFRIEHLNESNKSSFDCERSRLRKENDVKDIDMYETYPSLFVKDMLVVRGKYVELIDEN